MVVPGRRPQPESWRLRLRSGLMLALLRASHPAPGAAVTIVAGVLAVAVELPPLPVLLVIAVIALDQLSVGWSNDWIDAGRDRASGRRDKPVATGEVSIRLVRFAALGSALTSLVLGFVLGPAAGLAHTVFLVSAWAYNIGLKRTALSVVPYIVSFGILPAFVTLALDPPRWPEWWVLAAGAALGIAAHLANVLPDLDDDAATGVRGFPHRLGARASGIGAFAVLSAASILLAVAVSGVGAAVGSAAVLLVSVMGVTLVLRGRLTRMLFVLILVSALVIVVSLAAAGPDLLAN